MPKQFFAAFNAAFLLHAAFVAIFKAMKKLLFLLIFSITCLVAAAQEMPSWKITDVEKYIAGSKDEVLVINFWATFCKPCVAEIPSFIAVTNAYKSRGVKLLLVSLDLPAFYQAKVAAFAKKHSFNVPIVWLNETNADYFCPKISEKWSGSIPATLIVNTQTGYRAFYEEEMESTDFKAALEKAFTNKAGSASPNPSEGGG